VLITLIALLAAGMTFLCQGAARADESVPTRAEVVGVTVGPPGNPTCRFLNLFRAELHWTPTSTEGAQIYRIYHRGPCPGSNDFHLLAEVPGARNTTYAGLKPSLLDHRYFVTAFLDNWESGPSNTIRVHCRPRLLNFPGPCCLRAETHHSQRTIELTWGSVVGASSYALLRSTQSGGPYELLAMTTTPAYKDTVDVAALTYYYVVVAVDAAGNESDPSAELAVPDVPPIPSSVPITLPSSGGGDGWWATGWLWAAAALGAVLALTVAGLGWLHRSRCR
jgi:hypothetical protein